MFCLNWAMRPMKTGESPSVGDDVEKGVRSGFMKALYVSPFQPSPVGGGGDHRAYQVVHDLEKILGEGNVKFIHYRTEKLRETPGQGSHGRRFQLVRWIASAPAVHPVKEYVKVLKRGWEKLYGYLRFVQKVVGNRSGRPDFNYAPVLKLYTDPRFTRRYKEILHGVQGPALCVIDHPSLVHLLPINKAAGIPTAACLHNAETFDRAAPNITRDMGRFLGVAMLEFADELRALAACDDRLFISRVDAGLINGLGLPSRCYPYRPVGEIRNNLLGVRRMRKLVKAEPGLFLVLGSGFHGAGRFSIEEFLSNLLSLGLPEAMHLVVAGKKTDELPMEYRSSKVDLRGWVDQNELNDLMTRAQAVLIPHRLGFGALTRLPELSCAGVPVISSRHPIYALDPPPGIEWVDDWPEWIPAMNRAFDAGFPAETPLLDYEQWEARQESPLLTVMERLSKQGRNNHGREN